METTHFNLKRLQYFIYRQTVLNIHTLIISGGSIFGVLLLHTIIMSSISPLHVAKMPEFHIGIFFIAGFIFTGKIFSELHDPLKGYFYLTLPVSNLERLIGSWLLSSPLYIIGYGIFTFSMISLAVAITDSPFPASSFFDIAYLRHIPTFLVLQTVFFLGACYFRKNIFPKTLLSVFLFFLSIGILTFIFGYFLFFNSEKADPAENSQFFLYFEINNSFRFYIKNKFIDIITFLFWFILGPFMLLVSYFKLKESQL